MTIWGCLCLYFRKYKFELIQNTQGLKDHFLNHINVGSGTDISIKDLATKISKMVEGKYFRLKKPNGTHQKKLDVSLMSRLG